MQFQQCSSGHHKLFCFLSNFSNTAAGTVAAGQQRLRALPIPAGAAPSRYGLFCLVCVVLVLVAVRFASWTMMAELCFSVDDYILFFFSNFSNTAAHTASQFCFFKQFPQFSSGHRKRIRQLRAPSLLDSSGFVPLLLLPAQRQAGRECSALCVLFSYSLLCASLRGR